MKNARPNNGFSLVEVALALGIISFALVALIGLLPVGLQSNRDSVDETQAMAVLHALVADRRSSTATSNSTIYNLPPLTSINSATVYINDDGTVNATGLNAHYRVVITPQVPAPAPATMTIVTPTFWLLHASWPAAAAASTHPASVEILASFPPS